MMNEETLTDPSASGTLGLLGDYLKQKRLDKNYSLEKLSQKTKISINILKSLENNDYEHLPSAAYIKGFVISYAKVLSLPIDEVIPRMENTHLTVLGKPFPALNHTKTMTSQITSHQSTESESSPQEMISNGDSIIQNTKSALPVLIFALVIMVFVGGYKLISSVVENEVNNYKAPDFGPKIESSSALVHSPTSSSSSSSSGTAENPDKNKKGASSENSTDNETNKPADFQRNFPPVEFKKIRSKLFSVRTDAPENNDATILPENIRGSINSNQQNIYVRAVTGNTWLSYKIDNNPIESVIVTKGNGLLLQGAEVRLFLGNVSVTKIFYNNYLIDAPTTTGVKSLIFPEESNTKFVLPLFPKAKDDVLYTSEDYMKRMNVEEEEIKKRQQ
jgi:cytoskeleton protein RodZ